MTHSINPLITDKQRHIIIGTVLGGSSIVQPSNGVNCYLSMRGKDYNWLYFKAEELSNLAADRALSEETTFRWHSKCYPVFNEYKNKFYDGKQRVLTLEILDGLFLQGIAFAVWFKDAGTVEKNRVVLNTHIWGAKGSETICDYFKLLGFDSEVITAKNKSKLYFTEESSVNFLKIVVTQLPYNFVKHLIF